MSTSQTSCARSSSFSQKSFSASARRFRRARAFSGGRVFLEELIPEERLEFGRMELAIDRRLQHLRCAPCLDADALPAARPPCRTRRALRPQSDVTYRHDRKALTRCSRCSGVSSSRFPGASGPPRSSTRLRYNCATRAASARWRFDTQPPSFIQLHVVEMRVADERVAFVFVGHRYARASDGKRGRIPPAAPRSRDSLGRFAPGYESAEEYHLFPRAVAHGGGTLCCGPPEVAWHSEPIFQPLKFRNLTVKNRVFGRTCPAASTTTTAPATSADQLGE